MKNSICTAPQIKGVPKVYEKWKESHVGDFSSFLKFMATPSVERELFLKELESDKKNFSVETRFEGSVMTLVIESLTLTVIPL